MNLPILPAQKFSFGSCCPSLSSLEDFQHGNKKVFLCWANIYITNIKYLCLVTNIPACKRKAFSERVAQETERLFTLIIVSAEKNL